MIIRIHPAYCNLCKKILFLSFVSRPKIIIKLTFYDIDSSFAKYRMIKFKITLTYEPRYVIVVL